MRSVIGVDKASLGGAVLESKRDNHHNLVRVHGFRKFSPYLLCPYRWSPVHWCPPQYP